MILVCFILAICYLNGCDCGTALAVCSIISFGLTVLWTVIKEIKKHI